MTIFDAIGNTPLVELRNLWDSNKSGVKIIVKLEGSNPGGSVKDRPAYKMVKDATENGLLTKDKTILEPTSGNTGIGLAMIGAALGYKVKLLMPACVSEERKSTLIALGAELELTPGCEKTDGSIRRAHYIMQNFGDQYFMPNQFDNPANWLAHYESTAPEIIKQTKGEVNYFVAGMGTSGTLMGCSRYFKDNKTSIKVIGVEPEINHRIQGLKNMNESIVPKIYDINLLDEKLICKDEDAFETVRNLAVFEGLFCGISSGAALWGAIQIAKRAKHGETIVALLPDRGDRYLSTEVFRSVCAMCPP
ncbi:MAG TPA: cysteine synthase family protein [Spirochaetota bacterium]|nr:cysteine synthase family protein [Spirochaetota bacterium]